VIALDLSPGMLASLREAMARDGIGNLRIVQGRWPLPPAQRPHADVALIANVGYDIEAIAEFLDAMEASANRLCVAVLLDRQPSALAERFWPPIHGEQRVRLPALHEFVELLTARGTRPDVTLVERPPRGFRDEAALLEFVRRQLWIAPGGERERRLAELVHREAVELPGGVGLSESDRAVQGIVRWKPRRRSA